MWALFIAAAEVLLFDANLMLNFFHWLMLRLNLQSWLFDRKLHVRQIFVLVCSTYLSVITSSYQQQTACQFIVLRASFWFCYEFHPFLIENVLVSLPKNIYRFKLFKQAISSRWSTLVLWEKRFLGNFYSCREKSWWNNESCQ